MRIRNRRKSGGFTLVELMVVVIIIGILAAVAVPIYLSQSRRARMSEAVTALGAIRSSEAVYKTEKGVYLAVAATKIEYEPSDTTNGPGLGLDCSKNTYFDKACFSVALDGTYGFIASCDGAGAGNAAPRAGEVNVATKGYQAQGRGNGQMRFSYDSGSTWTPWE